MLKRILAFALLGSIVGCGTTKPKIVTTKAEAKNTTVANAPERKTETLVSTSKTTVYSEQVKEYVVQYKDIAQANMKSHGVPASITLAQGILESGAGRGKLAMTANNHFGIKCHTGWEGDKIYHDDDSAQECFRKYAEATESFNDHSLFLTTRGRYAALFKLEKDDYEGWAKGLRAAGYATDPKYPEKLIGLIERFNLAQYDAEVLGGNFVPVTKDVPAAAPVAAPVATAPATAAPSSEPVAVVTTTTPEPVAVITTTEPVDEPDPVAVIATPATTAAPAPVATTASAPAQTAPAATTPAPTATTAVPVAATTTTTTAPATTTPAPSIEDAAKAEGEAVYTVVKGDTLYSISKRNNTTVDALIQLNGLTGNAISIGQVLKLK